MAGDRPLLSDVMQEKGNTVLDSRLGIRETGVDATWRYSRDRVRSCNRDGRERPDDGRVEPRTGASATSKKASLELARRLSMSMDDRSPYTLLILVAYKGEEDE